jgi:hypothetical protein
VHGPRYLQARYPDHETLARYDWFALFVPDSGRTVLEGPHYYGARAPARRSGRRVQVSLPENLAMRAWPLPQHAMRNGSTTIMDCRFSG